jgi:hypothetical protein
MKKIVSVALSLVLAVSVGSANSYLNNAPNITVSQQEAMGYVEQPWYDNKWVKVAYQGTFLMLAVVTFGAISFGAGQYTTKKRFSTRLMDNREVIRDANARAEFFAQRVLTLEAEIDRRDDVSTRLAREIYKLQGVRVAFGGGMSECDLPLASSRGN